MKIRLTHTCNIKEAQGHEGDVVDCPDDIAQKLIERRGAVAVEVKPAPKKQDKK